MCGIFGIVSRSKGETIDLLHRAVDLLRHRGPDDAGTQVIDLGPNSGEVGLAHTRLSIIDLSPLGHQPMQDPVTGNWIVYNGEIYNFRQLRGELENLGVQFRSHSDTEVILAAYRVWHEDSLDRLRGMFAFGLWDAHERKLVLARDPMGIKPLYYSQSERGFVFASELRTILRVGLVPAKLDGDGLMNYLAFGSVYEPRTIIEEIFTVPSGHILTTDGVSISSRQYWNPLASAEIRRPTNGSSTTAQLPETLRDAVSAHIVSDVPVGVFLSGGIDSSSIVALLSQAGVRANTFSLVFREPEFDESPYSRAIAAKFKTEHHEIRISVDDTLAALPDALHAMDQPTIDGINTYLVSAKARANGMKVALTGLGADEMFAGYSNFRRVPKIELAAALSARLPRVARSAVARSVRTVAGKSVRGQKLAELASAKDAPVHPYFITRTLFAAGDRTKLLSLENLGHVEEEFAAALQRAAGATMKLDPINRVSYLESNCYMKNTLLRDSDFMSMAHGLELRVPFLDRSLVEACFRIPGASKLNGREPKSLLLESLGVELPPDVVNRPKRGFTLPFERWLRGEMKPMLEATLTTDFGLDQLHPPAVRDIWRRFLSGATTWSRPWSLFVLRRWCELNM